MIELSSRRSAQSLGAQASRNWGLVIMAKNEQGPSRLKCKCAITPPVTFGRMASNLPTRHYESVSTKPHGALPRAFQTRTDLKTCVHLIRCKICGQLWQVDAWSRNAGWTSWPDLAIKIASAADWDRFDDTTIRREHFPSFDRGLEFVNCATPGCKDMRIVGMDQCGNCASKAWNEARQSGSRGD